MGVRESATLRSGIALPCGALFTDLWPDRSAPDCGMDSGGQTQCAVSTSDAQIHLEPSATWCLKMCENRGRASADPLYRMAVPKLRRLLYRKIDTGMIFS